MLPVAHLVPHGQVPAQLGHRVSDWPHRRLCRRDAARRDAALHSLSRGFSRAGFTRFGNDKSTIFQWLRSSGLGYKLGIFGKLMNGLNVGGGLGAGGASAATFVNGVPVVNTTIAGSAASPAPLNLVGYSGATNGAYLGGQDPDTGVAGSSAQYYLPGFDIPGTAANPYTGYPGYQGISKDKWYVFQNLPGFSDWQVSNNGNYEVHGYQGKPGDPSTWNASDYSTDVLSNQLVSFINEAGADNKPFFAWVSPYPPHAPALPAPRHVGKLNGTGVRVPRNPNFNPGPAVQGQKVSAIGQYPQYGQAQVEALDWVYQTRAESLLSYDDLVGAAVAALAASGQLNNTYIVFTSDNGYHLGQFNLAGGKQTPYEEDVHLPLYIRGPGVAAGSTIPHLVANIDLAVTFADLAGVNVRNTSAIPTAVDGRSFKDVLLSGGTSTPADAFRQAFLIEKVITGDDYFHVPTPFVRYTEGNASADLWAQWRSYPQGGFPYGGSVFGALAANGAGGGAANAAGNNTVSGGVSPYPGLQSALWLSAPWSARYATFANGNSPAWDHLGNAGNPAANGSPGGWAGNGAFAGEPQWTTLAVALSGYGNNKGASFEDLYANAASRVAGGPTDALGNGILGALNVAGQSEGSTWWWGAAYAVNYGAFRNGSPLTSTTAPAYLAPTTPAAAWLNATFGALNPALLPAGWAAVPGGNAAVNPFVDPAGGDGGVKVDYQTVTGFNFPSPYYGLRVVSSLYNLLYVEFPTGFELYDLNGTVTGTADPWQLTNVYASVPPALKLALAANLEQLKICRGNGNLAGGATPATSVSCVLANVPAFTAAAPPAAATWAVTSSLTLAGYSKATFGVDAQVAFVRALANTLSVLTSQVVITSIADAPPAAGRHLLAAGDAVLVASAVRAPSAAAAARIQSTLSSAAASTQLATALQAALPLATGVTITTPTVVPAGANSAAGRASKVLPLVALAAIVSVIL